MVESTSCGGFSGARKNVATPELNLGEPNEIGNVNMKTQLNV